MPKYTEDIQKDLLAAQKNKDALRVEVLRFTLSALKNQAIEKRDAFSEDDELAVLKSEAKKRKESIELFEKGGRDDLLKKEKDQLVILEEYLPAQMGEEQVEEIVKKYVADGMTMQDMGTVMGKVMAELQGQADGKMVNELVKKHLSSNS